MRRPPAGPSTRRRASARRSSMSASSSATAMTRSPRSAAPTSPASGSPTSSPSCCSAAASPPTSSSRPATSPMTSRSQDGGGYRYYRDERSAPSSAPRWMSSSRSTRARWSRSRRGRRSAGRAATSEPEGAWHRSIRAKALDLLRGLLPAATLSHVGIYASGQAYEQLIMRLMASPLPEARDYGAMILGRAAAGDAELRLAGRAPRPRRRVGLLPQRRREDTERWVARLGLDRRGPGADAPSVELIHVDGSEEDAARLLPVRVRTGAGDRDPRPPRRPRPRGARRTARGADRRAGQPSPPPRPRL